MPRSAGRKQAKTFSLSEDVIDILETYRRKKRIESLTSAVEEIVREWRISDLAAQVTAYYGSISDEETNQDEQWGKFSENEM
jgi:hypothetical protein